MLGVVIIIFVLGLVIIYGWFLFGIIDGEMVYGVGFEGIYVVVIWCCWWVGILCWCGFIGSLFEIDIGVFDDIFYVCVKGVVVLCGFMVVG